MDTSATCEGRVKNGEAVNAGGVLGSTTCYIPNDDVFLGYTSPNIGGFLKSVDAVETFYRAAIEALRKPVLIRYLCDAVLLIEEIECFIAQSDSGLFNVLYTRLVD